MIKDFNQIDNYPEYPKQNVINLFVDFVIKDSFNISFDETLDRFEQLSDKLQF